jgi:hypothetical protein
VEPFSGTVRNGCAVRTYDRDVSFIFFCERDVSFDARIRVRFADGLANHRRMLVEYF